MDTIYYSESGPYVAYLQLALSRAGFDPGTPDGIFGPRTLAALLQFQSQNMLPDTGEADAATWEALIPYLTGYRTHILRRGDTLWRLALTYKSSLSAIRIANPDVVPENLPIGESLIIPLDFPLVPTDVPYSARLVGWIAEGLTARYPFLAAYDYGLSVMEQPLVLFQIGSGSRQVFFNASHHANEWITTPVVLKWLENYALAYTQQDKIEGIAAAELFKQTSLYIAPLVNPDGVDLVTGALASDNFFYRQAEILTESYPEIPFPSGWKANINGVDLNLNYPAGWELARELKCGQGFCSPGPRDFVGPAPLSEPESRAVYDLTLAQDFSITLSFHSQGQLIYWKYADYLPPCSYEIARVMELRSGYRAEETPAYSGNAGYKDWFIQTFQRPGYTIEVGLGTNPLPISQFSEIYEASSAIMGVAMQAAYDLSSVLAALPAPAMPEFSE